MTMSLMKMMILLLLITIITTVFKNNNNGACVQVMSLNLTYEMYPLSCAGAKSVVCEHCTPKVSTVIVKIVRAVLMIEPATPHTCWVYKGLQGAARGLGLWLMTSGKTGSTSIKNL